MNESMNMVSMFCIMSFGVLPSSIEPACAIKLVKI